jgi:bis(5'-nucleosyl)-tetraphosphatase (symmetrical)
MIYLVGDVQGCDAALGRLLDQVAFSPSRDRLWLLGDLVNRGPDSLAVLRRVQALAGSAFALLGNHDLHLLAAAHGVRAPGRGDTLDAVLAAPDRDALLDTLAARPLAAMESGWLLVHAGVLPGWTPAQTLALAAEVQAPLSGPGRGEFLATMYGNKPRRWDDTLAGAERRRVIVNALTRLRFCAADGTMDFDTKDGAGAAPGGMKPWFDWPHRASAGTPVAFGHWSTLGLVQRPDLLALDTGCVWGGCLSAARLPADGGAPEVIQVKCPQAQRPGG